MQCALCRQGWRPAFDSDLEAKCGQLGKDWHALQLHDPVPVQPLPSAGVASVDADVAMAPAAPELDAFFFFFFLAPFSVCRAGLLYTGGPRLCLRGMLRGAPGTGAVALRWRGPGEALIVGVC